MVPKLAGRLFGAFFICAPPDVGEKFHSLDVYRCIGKGQKTTRVGHLYKLRSGGLAFPLRASDPMDRRHLSGNDP